MVRLLTALVFIAAALAGTTRVVAPGLGVWQAPVAGFEPPEQCDTCHGPRGFAVLDGEGWILLTDRLVGTAGHSMPLPSTGVDVAAGPSGLWVLCREHLAHLEEGVLVPQPVRWSGTPLEVSGHGSVLSTEGIDGRPLPEGRTSPWGGDLSLVQEGSQWIARWPGQPPRLLPGAHIVDLRLVGELADGAQVAALTDSRDGSAPDAVRFIALRPGAVEEIVSGPPNGDLEVRPRRTYAVDPRSARVYTLVVEGEELSLRRY